MFYGAGDAENVYKMRDSGNFSHKFTGLHQGKDIYDPISLGLWEGSSLPLEAASPLILSHLWVVPVVRQQA
jgi:hypothetical protein